jgi:hypothetical protein
MTSLVLPVGETVRRTTADRELLLSHVRDADDLVAPYLVKGGPLGDFCESLRDLVAHVLMWDEINLAVLAEAEHGRSHWSLTPGWEEPAMGQALNRAGVAAGREFPVELLVDRFVRVRDALVAQLSGYTEEEWTGSVGELAQHAMTVPGSDPYWHAALHLGAVL